MYIAWVFLSVPNSFHIMYNVYGGINGDSLALLCIGVRCAVLFHFHYHSENDVLLIFGCHLVNLWFSFSINWAFVFILHYYYYLPWNGRTIVWFFVKLCKRTKSNQLNCEHFFGIYRFNFIFDMHFNVFMTYSPLFIEWRLIAEIHCIFVNDDGWAKRLESTLKLVIEFCDCKKSK